MVYVMLADGFEEIEAIATIDILRRAEIDTQTVSISNDYMVTGAHDIPVKADWLISEVNLMTADMIILPGGMPGTLNLDKNEILSDALYYRAENNLWVAAICAAPSILGKRGLLKNIKATCYPGFEKELIDAIITEDRVVVSGSFITSKGAGTASDFALSIISILKDNEVADKIRKQMQY